MSQTRAEIQVREQMINHASEWELTNQEVEEIEQEINTITSRGGY